MVKVQHAPPPPLVLPTTEFGTATFANQLAQYINDFYISLNIRSAKPQPGQWTVLASFLALKLTEDGSWEAKVLSLATGVKCIGGDVTNRDDVLVDMHAEVLARRELEILLMREIEAQGESSDPASDILERDDPHSSRYHLRSDTAIWLYTSHAPCGSASNASHLSRLDEEDRYLRSFLTAQGITPSPSTSTPTSDFRSLKSETTPRLGKKPSRADAVATSAYTCSDKLSRYQVMGLQGGRLARVLDPIRMSGIIVGEDFDELGLRGLFGGGGADEWSRVRQGVDLAMEGRDGPGREWLTGIPEEFVVLPTSERFKYGREAALKSTTPFILPNPIVDLSILPLPLPLLRDHLLPKPIISPSSIASTYHAHSHVEVIGPHGRPTNAVRDKKTKEWGERSRSRLARGELWGVWKNLMRDVDRRKGSAGWREAREWLEVAGPFKGWHNEVVDIAAMAHGGR